MTNNLNALLSSSDISENRIWDIMPEILTILLIDRTTSTARKISNIIWGNNHYTYIDEVTYAPKAQIHPYLITGKHGNLIKPRALKSLDLQKERTRSKAEVFTPTWIVKKQNDAVDESYQKDDLDTYIGRTWLEITCGEAPYMATRYEMSTGEIISLSKREGFLDRKLRLINRKVRSKKKWEELAIKAYQACYGFEWNGDSLLLARENLLYTMRDYYYAKWEKEPPLDLFKKIAEIISYNVFQMDGLKYIIPLSDQTVQTSIIQLTFFDTMITKTVKPTCKYVKIMNWATGKMEMFKKGIT